MGLFDFFTGKGKSAPAPAGATDTAAAPAGELKKELEKLGLDASKIDIKVEGGKVTLGGSAASTAEAEKIVLAIGNTKGVAQVENNIAAADAGAGSRFYVVKDGDTLWKIAESQYGHGKGAKYQEIFEANKPMLKDPDLIYPGQRLRIPGLAPDSSAKAAPASAGEWKPPSEIAAAPASGGTEWKPPSEIAGKKG
jgi:nucleoid-associated protein YgaU